LPFYLDKPCFFIYYNKKDIGAIAGDIIGSVYEWHNTKSITDNVLSILPEEMVGIVEKFSKVYGK